MFQVHHFVVLFLVLVFTQENHAIDSDKRHESTTVSVEPRVEHIQSPMLEVLMHLPPNFRNVRSFKNCLGIKPERIKRKAVYKFKKDRDPRQRSVVDVRSYEVAQPVQTHSNIRSNTGNRSKRETGEPKPIIEKLEPQKLVSSAIGPDFREKYTDQGAMLPMPDAIRGPVYTTYPVKEFDIIDIDDPDDNRRRRNESSDNRDDNTQRDKRTFGEGGGGENGETTTASPFWKRKKENPPFVTGRGSNVQKGNVYTPPQHRSGDNVRESHSIKNLDKSVQSNEINRSNQDNYYSSTNRRTYNGRQSETATPSTPKSVYDTIDYSKRSQEGRGGFGRSHDDKKETLRDGRVTHEQYNNRPIQYNYPSPYDRPYYQPPYPYPTEVVGRGVEYYHRTYDPTTGRIIYYANMPETGRTYDYRYMDPISRNFYVNRPYVYDPFYRNYVPPYDYRFGNAFGRSMDYMRAGRSSSQAYSYPQQERDKFPRDARFNGGFEKEVRLKEDPRNKTYVIYDADEGRSQFPRQSYSSDSNRFGHTPVPNNLPASQPPFRPLPFGPPMDYFPQGPFPYRNQMYPSPQGQFWGFNPRSGPGATDLGPNNRAFNAPEVQLPLTTSNRNIQPTVDLNGQPKKS